MFVYIETGAGMISADIVEMSSAEDVETVRGLLGGYVRWLFDSFPDQTEDLAAYYSPERVQAALDEVATKLRGADGLALIARVDERPVGCVLAYPTEPGIAELKRLFVLPGARGNGLGRRLIETVGLRMAALGYPVIRLDTATFLLEAIALYRRIGFVEIAPYIDLPTGTAKTALFMEWRVMSVSGPSFGTALAACRST